jgi:hypothetical protein
VADPVEWDLNALLAACRRRVTYLQWVVKGAAEGTKKHAEAEHDLGQMRTACDYFVDAIFRSVTRQPPPPARPEEPKRKTANDRLGQRHRRPL